MRKPVRTPNARGWAFVRADNPRLLGKVMKRLHASGIEFEMEHIPDCYKYKLFYAASGIRAADISVVHEQGDYYCNSFSGTLLRWPCHAGEELGE